MPSRSLQEWTGARATRLDEIENAHRMVGGPGPGRRYATQQINQAYAVLLSSQFQGFCRDLHSECVQHIVQATPLRLRNVLGGEFVYSRALDRGNPSTNNIGTDFARIGLRIWEEAIKLDTRNGGRRKHVEELIAWRNAIAHQDFDPARLGGSTTLRLRQTARWRGACTQLADAFDRVAGTHLVSLLAFHPW